MKAQTAVLQIAWPLSNHFLIRGAAERWGGGGVLSFPASSSSPPPAPPQPLEVTQDSRRIFSYNWKAHIFQYYFQYSWRQHRIYSVEWDSRSLKWQEALSSTFSSFCWQVTFFFFSEKWLSQQQTCDLNLRGFTTAGAVERFPHYCMKQDLNYDLASS